MDDKEIKEKVLKEIIYDFTHREMKIIDLTIPLARTSESNLFKKKLNQKDKIIQGKDRAYSKEIRDLSLTIENLRRYETKRVLKERQRIKKELEKQISFAKSSNKLSLLMDKEQWATFWERIGEVKKKLWGGKFWTSGYYVNTVGQYGNAEVIKAYVQNQGKEYKRIHYSQLELL